MPRAAIAARRVVVFGAGALGSHFVLDIRNFEVEIVVVDDDRLEKRNALTQFCVESAAGRNKAIALAQSMELLYRRKVTPRPTRLVRDNAVVLLAGATLAVDCLDNGASRRTLQAAARELRTPLLHGALSDAQDGYGRVVWMDRFVIDDESVAGAPTCRNGENLPLIAIVSGYLATSAQEFLGSGSQFGYEISAGGVQRRR